MDMKLIPLRGRDGNGKFAKVDDEDYEWLNARYWYADTGGYATRAYKAAKKDPVNQSMFMHRRILAPTWKCDIDHINHDRLDNRKSNLRACTHKENMNNRKKK